MKLLLIVCLALVVGVAVGWMVNGVSPADAAGGPGGGAAPLGNGDVNGDGKINVSDAVYLLAHLFTGGPPVKVSSFSIRLRSSLTCTSISWWWR